MIYTIQVSNHPEAGARIPSQAASESWETISDNHISSTAEARRVVDGLSLWYKHVRCFKGASVGKLFYAVLRDN